MTRLAALLTCFVFCPTVYGFPAPKTEDLIRNAEMIVGVWECTSLIGLLTDRCFLEFRDDGTFRTFWPPGSEREFGDFGYYTIVDNNLQLRSKPFGKLLAERPVQFRTKTKMLFGESEFVRSTY